MTKLEQELTQALAQIAEIEPDRQYGDEYSALSRAVAIARRALGEEITQVGVVE